MPPPGRKPDPSPDEFQGPSPNPHTNLAIADIAIIGGAMLARVAIERALLGRNYSPDKAKAILKGRKVSEVVLHGLLARVATSSVPGAILVGGGLAAKTLYDRARAPVARRTGTKRIERMVSRASSE